MIPCQMSMLAIFLKHRCFSTSSKELLSAFTVTLTLFIAVKADGNAFIVLSYLLELCLSSGFKMKVKKEKKGRKKKTPPKISERRVNAANFPARRIPSNALKRSLEIATNPMDGFWLTRNTSCATPAHLELYLLKDRSPTTDKLRLASLCLMQRDYKNLAKLLASSLIGDTILQKDSFTVFAEYAEMLKKFTRLKTSLTNSTESTT